MVLDTALRSQLEVKTPTVLPSNYSILLEPFGLEYKKVGYYWQVGASRNVQGWIIHLTAVLSQIEGLLTTIIPFLIKEQIAFKIATDESTSEDILNGNFGIAQIGKVVAIYPEGDPQPVVTKLIELTKNYKGPSIPTDLCLGNIVYTRYGSINPIIKSTDHSQEKFIYNHKGELIIDPYNIPFQLPEGIPWPFGEITTPTQPSPPKLLNRLYKITDVVKSDPRGNVFKGLFVKSLFQVKQCIIKQGFNNMSSDKPGRDIRDRLIWQSELHRELSGVVPLPLIYDTLQEEAFVILVMEFVKGDSLFTKIQQVNPHSKSWQDLTLQESSTLLKYAIEIAAIICVLHRNDYVHRDIVPVNFLITKSEKIIMIDLELAYNLKTKKPFPPFALGTPGFISPEQEAVQPPTIDEDAYGLGATLLYLFTGIFPNKFNTKNDSLLFTNLNFLIADEEIAKTIANCLNHDPKFRPSISTIHKVLSEYHQKLKVNHSERRQTAGRHLDYNRLKNVIYLSLKGLSNPPIVCRNSLWYSKRINIQNFTSRKNTEFVKNPGLTEGIGGILYVLARLAKIGINIESCKEGVARSLELIENVFLNQISELSPGLYSGAAGIAMALGECVNSELWDNSPSNKGKILGCLKIPNSNLNLANGLAGQGLATLRCIDFLDKVESQNILDSITATLLAAQNNKGLWSNMPLHNRANAAQVLNIAQDDTGIIWFLLDFLSLFDSPSVKKSVEKAIDAILSEKKYKSLLNYTIARKECYEFSDGGTGYIIMLIKAYEIFHDQLLKDIAEKALLQFPSRIIYSNFSQVNGLAGLGELYLEAYRVFHNGEWKARANWIANVFIHCLNQTAEDTGHWIMEQNSPPTADFLVGNSGIIHFLARCLSQNDLGYRLLK